MGFVRGSLSVIVGVLIFISLMLSGIFLNLSLSLQYENVRDGITPIVSNFTDESDSVGRISEKAISVAQIYCNITNQSNFMIQEGNYNINISCESVAEGKDSVIDEVVGEILYDVYYEEYNCTFLECFEETEAPFFLISEKSQEYWQGKFRYALILSLVLLVPFFFLMQKRKNFPLVVGSLIIIASLPLLGFGKIISALPDNILTNMGAIFFTQSHFVFLRMIIFGGIFIVVGVLIKLFGVGFGIRNLIEKIRTSKKEQSIKKSSVKKDSKKNLKK